MLYHRKRKSNKKFFITVIILFLIKFVSSLNSNINETSSNIANTVLEPLNKVLYQFNASIKNSFEDVFGSRKTRQDVNRLEKENKELTEKPTNNNSYQLHHFLVCRLVESGYGRWYHGRQAV